MWRGPQTMFFKDALVGRRDDGNAAERIQGQKTGVSSDDGPGPVKSRARLGGVDQGHQLPGLRLCHEARRGDRASPRRQRRPLVVLNDADDHRTGVSAGHRSAPALRVKEVPTGLEHFVRHSAEARPQVEAEVPATTRADHVDVAETDPVDHAQPVVFGLGQHGIDSHLPPLGEFLEPGVGRGLQDDKRSCHNVK